MRHELGAVDHEMSPGRVHHLSNFVQSVEVAGDVGSARDAHEEQPSLRLRDHLAEAIHVERAVGDFRRREEQVPFFAPRQVVGVVLHGRDDDDRVLRDVQAIGQLVDGFRGVLAEDDRVEVGIVADELPCLAVRGIVRVRGKARLVAAAAMDGRIPGHEFVDLAEDAL